MLKGVPALLSPELLYALARMGHGDEIGERDGVAAAGTLIPGPQGSWPAAGPRPEATTRKSRSRGRHCLGRPALLRSRTPLPALFRLGRAPAGHEAGGPWSGREGLCPAGPAQMARDTVPHAGGTPFAAQLRASPQTAGHPRLSPKCAAAPFMGPGARAGLGGAGLRALRFSCVVAWSSLYVTRPETLGLHPSPRSGGLRGPA